MSNVVPSAGQEATVLALARGAVAQAAPDELVLFDETAEEFIAQGRRQPKTSGADEAVGFGLDLAMVTPVAVMVATAAVQAVGAVVGEVWKEEGTPVVRSWFRRLFRLDRRRRRKKPSDQRPPMPLTPEQAQRVRVVALERALALGVPGPTASILADSITGGLVAGS